jgi:hypothetical protein
MPAEYGIDGVGGVHVDQRTTLDLLRLASGRAHCFVDASRSCAGPERTPRCWLPAAPTRVRPPPCLPAARTTGAGRGDESDDAAMEAHVQWNAAKWPVI